MFRIRHKPTKKFIKKNSSMGWTATVLNRVLVGNNPNNYKLSSALTSGLGHVYNTKQGVVKFFMLLNPSILNQFEVVEYSEIKGEL